MKRTPSRLAQLTFNLALKLTKGAHQTRKPFKNFVARANLKALSPLLKTVGSGHTVMSKVYGHTMTMPSEHPLAGIMLAYPQHNRPLALSAVAVAEFSPQGVPLAVVDVGANIGDTIALIEQWKPGIYSYLCLEPEPDLAEICRMNHGDNKRVTVRRSFIGEDEGATVKLEDDGRANPMTTISGTEAGADVDQLVRLDTLAIPFAKEHGRISMIKVDTEGYDFSVLRSASKVLREYAPGLYFEWYGDVLRKAGEDVYSGFEHLMSAGYRHFVFFTAFGDYYCNCTDPDRRFLHGLMSAAEANPGVFYFDVFATTSEPVANGLIDLCISINEKEVYPRS
jgi:FkbM family methyltransferase